MEKTEDIFECAPFFNVASQQNNYGTQTDVPLKRNLNENLSIDNQGVTLHWQNVCVFTKSNKQCSIFKSRPTVPSQIILDNVSGAVHPGSLVAIVGCSAVSSTTLLKALALKLSPSLTVSGNVALNGYVLERQLLQQMAGFVGSTKYFYSAITVREHLWFTAKLRLGSRFTNEQIRLRINGIVNQTKLHKLEDELIRHLSDGELKRLAIATEDIVDPPLLFCDEPTRELREPQDSIRIVGILENMAAKGKTILCSIDQPTSCIFGMFTEVCLLTNQGQVAFMGPIKEAINFFESLGFECPSYFSQANYFIQTLNQSSGDDLKMICDKFSASRYSSRLSTSITASVKRHMELSIETYVKYSTNRYKTKWFTEFILLLKRTAIISARHRRVIISRLVQKLMVIILASMVYLKVDSITPTNFMGIVLIIIIANFYPTLLSVTQSLHAEMVCLVNEKQKQLYNIETFYVTKLLSTIPECLIESLLSISIAYWMMGIHTTSLNYFITVVIVTLLNNIAIALGCLVVSIFDDRRSFQFILTPVSILMLAVSGIYSSICNIKPFVRWLHYLSFFHYTAQALQQTQWNKPILQSVNINEISNDTIIYVNINTTLISEASFSHPHIIEEESLGVCILSLSILCLSLHLVSCVMLRLKTRKYTELVQ